MTKAELISSLVEKKMQENDGTNILAYTTGLNDMYNKIHSTEISSVISSLSQDFELKDGDYFVGTIREYDIINKLECPHASESDIRLWSENMKKYGYAIFIDDSVTWDESDSKNRELTFDQFYRGAKKFFDEINGSEE